MKKFAQGVALVALVALVTGCKSSKCKDGAYQNKEPAFCLNLPPEFKAEPLEQRGKRQVLKFKGPHYAFMEIGWGDESFEDAVKASEPIAKSPGNEVIGSGETPDKGWFYHIKFKDAGTHQLQYLYKRPSGGILSCWSNLKADEVNVIKPACESLTALSK